MSLQFQVPTGQAVINTRSRVYSAVNGVVTVAEPASSDVADLLAQGCWPLGGPTAPATTSTPGIVQPDGVTIIVAGGVISAPGAGALLVARTVLTQAQVLALNTAPVTLVPAPGAGFAIQPSSIVVVQAGTPTYVTDDEDFNFVIGANALASLGCFKDVGDGGAANYIQSAGALDQDYFNGNTNLYANLPLIGSTTTNPTGTGGNVIVTVYYSLVPLS